MAKKRESLNLDLFNQKLSEIQIEYPVVVEYEDKGLEAFFENGVRFYLNIKDGTITFVKSKWKSIHGDNNQADYEWYIRKLVWTHRIVTVEEFNKYYEDFNSMNEELESVAFEHDFAIVEEVNFKPLHKKVKTNEQDKKEEGETGYVHPF